jgi:hypothetical protein
LEPVWRRGSVVRELPGLQRARAQSAAELAALPARLRELEPADPPWPLVASDGLVAEVERLVHHA